MINPFDLSIARLSSDQLNDTLDHLMDAFAAVLSDASDFSEAMLTLLTPCVLTLLLRPRSDLTDLKGFFDEDQNARLLADAKRYLRHDPINQGTAQELRW